MHALYFDHIHIHSSLRLLLGPPHTPKFVSSFALLCFALLVYNPPSPACVFHMLMGMRSYTGPWDHHP